MPNLNHTGWVSGNHWAVASRCDRCGTVEYKLFDADDGSEGNLQCVNPPDNWRYTQGMMLCPSCYESFVSWMGECIDKNC